MDTISIDYGPIIGQLNELRNEIRSIYNALDVINGNIGIVDKKVDLTKQELSEQIDDVSTQIDDMERRQRYLAALQRAITEIIRVRQELEQKFGSHQKVRDSMLGILHANDLNLVKTQTISQITEELMISAPKYWLAPALIALSAWISDDPELANRAVKEAIKRDAEKTYLLFALLTRRVKAGRLETDDDGDKICFRWLSKFFELQDPYNMKKSIIAYIDAYENGVFGEDRDHICEDNINHWMDILLKSDENFAETQKNYWSKQWSSRCRPLTIKGAEQLKLICPQYNDMENYVSRIDASDNQEYGIKKFINTIVNATPNKEKLIKDIDEQLEKLVTNYDEAEEPLRDEEYFLTRVKELQGDEDRAKAEIEALKAGRVDEDVNFAMRLNESISKDDGIDIASKRTALFFMKNYISESFNEFITANKQNYPLQIDLIIKQDKSKFSNEFTWKGSTQDGENASELINSLEKKYDDELKKSLDGIIDDEALKLKKQAKICFFLFIFIIPIFIGISKNNQAKAIMAKNASDRSAINREYSENKKKNVQILSDAISARKEANSIIEKFLTTENSEVISI